MCIYFISLPRPLFFWWWFANASLRALPQVLGCILNSTTGSLLLNMDIVTSVSGLADHT